MRARKIRSAIGAAWTHAARKIRAVGSPRARTWARRVLLAVAALAIFYVVAINVLLGTPLLRTWVNRNDPKIRVDYTTAWSIWPGRVHVENLAIRAQASKVEILFAFDEAALTIDVASLLRKRFVATDIRAAGFTARARERHESPEIAVLKNVDAYPPIPGFADPPLRKIGPPTPDPGDDDYDLWTVDLDGFEVTGVREIWINEYRFSGAARALGRVYLKPLRRIEVGPCALDIEGGEVFLGEDPVAVALEGRLEATIDPIDPRESAIGLRLFEGMTGSVAVDGEIESARFLRRYLRGPAEPELEHARGRAHTAVRIEKGVLLPGSVVHVDTERVALRWRGTRVAWSGTDDLVVVSDGSRGRPEARLTLDVRGLEVTRSDLGWAPTRVPVARISARSSELLLSRPFSDLAFSLDLPRAEIVGLAILNPLFPEGEGLAFEGGSALASVTFHGSLETMRGAGDAEVSAEGAHFRWGGISYEGKTRVRAKLSGLRFTDGIGDLSGSSVELHELVTRHDGETLEPWWGTLELVSARLHTRKNAGLYAGVRSRSKDAGPILETLEARGSIPPWVAHVLPLGGLEGTAQVKLGSSIELTELHASGGPLEIRGEIRIRDGEKRGAFLFNSGPFALGLDVKTGGSSLKVVDAADWYARRAKSDADAPVR